MEKNPNISKLIDKVSRKDYKEFVDNFWLNLGDVTKIRTGNMFAINEHFRESPVLGLIDILRKPENFGYTCQVLFGITLLPFQVVSLRMLWNHAFPMFIATRGGGKTFLLALYVLLLALFKPGSKVVMTGSSFRQAKILFSYCENIWKNAPIFKDILSVDKTNKPFHNVDMYEFKIGTSTIISIPTGSGETIRGLRSSCLLTDEFNSIDIQVFEEIMQGFSSVSMNPIANVKQISTLEALKVLGKITHEQAEIEANQIQVNQHIISGTCGYTFEHLYKYWKRYHEIIMSGGDEDKLRQIHNGEIQPGFNWKDYAIVRLPYDILPKGYMDLKTIGKAKVTTSSPIFFSEFCAIFQSDSLGFFRRTLIEKCTCLNGDPVLKKDNVPLEFNAMLIGDKTARYIMAVDPAAEEDNFALIILEIQPNHRRIVYCWTVNKEKHKAKLRAGLAQEHDYYRFCVRKIRDLMKVFPIEALVVDSQGGGVAVREVLGDPNHLQARENPIYEIEEQDVDKDTDSLPGLHILHMIQFSDAKWVYNANHGLRQDMETQELTFPVKDSLAFGMAREDDKIHRRIKVSEEDPDLENICDTLEDCMLEIEELKNELVLIEHSKTPSGRDKWDTPQVKGVGTKKGRLRKDRYSALLMANAVGRELIARVVQEEYVIGGFAGNIIKGQQKGHASGGEYGMAVQRNRGKRW